MFFYLIGEKVVYYTDFDRMENTLEKSSVNEYMFTSFMVVNGKYEQGKKLTYDQFVTIFFMKRENESGSPAKKGLL